MKKVIGVFLVVLTLTACQSEDKQMELLGDVSLIEVSESRGYGGLNENHFTVLDQKETVSRFEEITEETVAVKQDIDVNGTKPDYDLLVRYENGETNGLQWKMDGESSRLTYAGHESEAYELNAEETNQLLDMLE
ncbi:hypothetical protein [Halobacillus sp. KGW1]|uniref:hypothetical protein n=1 Tax=Halobacillus sp. KGW1 TaxID=1793726 RepID=UPI0007835E68|nr:hypothetical protein [Halobacillus sp. KGW1]